LPRFIMATSFTVRTALGLLIAAVSILGVSVRGAAASPITWVFTGTIGEGNSPHLAEIPDGTPVRVAWTFDPSTSVNQCAANQPTGWYENQSLQVDIYSTIGDLTYTATGFLISDSILPQGCVNNAGIYSNNMELRFGGIWQGPDLPSAHFLGDTGTAPGLFWVDGPLQGPGTLHGAFPTVQPQSVSFTMAAFFNGSLNSLGFPSYSIPGGQLTAVPEPTTLSLLAGAALFVAGLRRGR
jgi:hypothetical protein